MAEANTAKRKASPSACVSCSCWAKGLSDAKAGALQRYRPRRWCPPPAPWGTCSQAKNYGYTRLRPRLPLVTNTSWQPLSNAACTAFSSSLVPKINSISSSLTFSTSHPCINCQTVSFSAWWSPTSLSANSGQSRCARPASFMRSMARACAYRAGDSTSETEQKCRISSFAKGMLSTEAASSSISAPGLR